MSGVHRIGFSFTQYRWLSYLIAYIVYSAFHFTIYITQKCYTKSINYYTW